ncbi:MAG: DUF1934 domain-containing protein [Lachnospiraceae bacterium]
MTRDVLVTISGLLWDILEGGEELENEPIEIITPANYFFKNETHYVLYDEVAEGIPGITKNTIKITGNQKLEIIKRGVTTSHMTFETGEKSLTDYKTPFGTLLVGVTTKTLSLDIQEDIIAIYVEYVLDMNQTAMADCTIRMSIKSKNADTRIF